MNTKKSPNPSLLLRLRSATLAGLFLLAGLLTVPAATWTGGGANADWTTAANWTPGVPAAGDPLIFDGFLNLAPNNNFSAGTPFASMTFAATANGFTLGGNSLGLLGALANLSPSPQTVDLPMVITNAITINAVGDITLSRAVTGAGSVTKLGVGTLTLNNLGYTGGTTVKEGTAILTAGSDTPFIMTGGTLMLNFFSYWTSPTITFSNNATVGTTATRIDVAGQIGSPGFKWTKSGPGTLNTVHWNPGYMVIQASSIDVTEGTLCNLPGGNGTNATWGGAAVPVTVSYGACIGGLDGSWIPNPIVLAGGEGTGRGALFTARQNNGTTTTVTEFTNSITLQSDTTMGVFLGSLRLSGNISGNAALTKIGITDANSANRLILGGNNTYTGVTTITTGAVQLASSGALPTGPSSGGVMMGAGASLDLNGYNVSINGLTDDGSGTTLIDNSSANVATLTFGGNDQPVNISGPVRNTGGGALSIVKVGNGTATLTGANTYSGSNVVTGGKLAIVIPSGTVSNGPVYLANGTELSLTKNVAGASIKGSGVTLGTSGSTILDIDLAGFGSPSVPILNMTNGTGIMSVGGTVTINIAGNANVMSAGQFPLIRYNTRAGNGSFVLGSLPSQIAASIVTNANGKSIDLLVTSAPVTKWVGNVNNLWDINTTMNWNVLGVPSKYQDGAGVQFEDTAQTTTVDLTTYLSPGGTLVNNSTKDYTFTGSGSLNGGDLIKSGTGKLTILNMSANGYNNTTISAGTLQIGNGDYFGSLGYGNIQNDATLVMNVSGVVAVPSTITGAGTLIKQNTNTLVLMGANAYSGGTTVSGGIVQLGTATALGTPTASLPLATVASGAAIDISGKNVTTTNTIVVSGFGVAPDQGALINIGGGAEVWDMNHGVRNIRLAADSAIGGGSGGIAIGNNGGGIDGRGYNLVKVGNNALMVAASAVTAPAQWIIGGGGVTIQAANPFGTGALITLTNGGWLDSWGNNGGGATYNIANNIIVGAGGGSIRNGNGAWWGRADYDNLSGAITLNDTLTLYHGMGQTNPGVAIGQLNLTGPISGPGGVTKTGPSFLATLSGLNTYTGPTIVTNGDLAIATRQQGGGAYAIYDGCRLALTPAPGYSVVPMSTLNIGSGTGATLDLSALPSLSSNAPVSATNVTVVGVNTIIIPGGTYLAPGQFPLIKFSTLGGGGSFVLGAEATRGFNASLVTNLASSTIDVLISASNPVKWVGNINNLWDVGTTANWSYLGASTSYQQPGAVGDVVQFDDSGLLTNVSIAVPVAPFMVTVTNSSKNYTLVGTNIGGPALLAKTGNGTLTVSNWNNYTGGTVINGGTVRIGDPASLNSAGIVTVNSGGALDLNSVNANGITVNISGSGFNGAGTIVNSGAGRGDCNPGTINMLGSATIGGPNEWDLRNGAKTLNCPTNTYSLTKVGASTIKFAGNPVISPNLGDIYIQSGTLQFEGSGSYGDTTKTIYVGNGAQFALWTSTARVNKSLICSNNSNITIAGGNAANLNIFTAPITLDSGRVNFNANFNYGMLVSNVISGDGGLWVQWNSDVLLSAANTFKGDFETQGRVKLVANASINPTNNVTVNNPGSGVLTVQDNAVVGGQNLRLWNGPATGALIVKNNGTINSKNIQVGTGVFADWSGRTDATFTLQSAQTLRVDDNSRIAGNVVAPSGATVSPGGGWYVQMTNIVFSNALTLQPGSTLWMDINKYTDTNSVVTNAWDQFTVRGTLTCGGTLQINLFGTNAVVPGDSYKLFTAGAISGTFATIAPATPGPGLFWDTSALYTTGTIKIGLVPNILPTYINGTGNLVLATGTELGRNYVLLSATNLNPPVIWSPVSTNSGTGGTITNLVPVNPALLDVFYRYQVQ